MSRLPYAWTLGLLAGCLLLSLGCGDEDPLVATALIDVEPESVAFGQVETGTARTGTTGSSRTRRTTATTWNSKGGRPSLLAREVKGDSGPDGLAVETASALLMVETPWIP